jgi:hypothetical protein
MEASNRTCLKCGQHFESSGPGNRFCRRCTLVNSRIPITEEQLKKQRGVKRHNGYVMNDNQADEAASARSDS